MSKAEGDPRKRDVAGAGPAASPGNASNAETPIVKPAAASDVQTSQDDIPPVHVLEAAQNQDRKETEDLLAGFDRPGHRPKAPSRERDFVDYYAKKKTPGVDSGSGRATSSAPPAAAPRGPRQADVSTVVRPRKGAGMPLWLAWTLAAAGMLLLGVFFAYVASALAPGGTSAAPTGPSAATTITAATPVPSSSVFDNIPPPAPPDPTATTTTTVVVVEPSTPPTTTVLADGPAPRGSARRDPRNPRGAGSSAVSTAGGGAATNAGSTPQDTKPPPRDDFIRDM